MLNFIMICLMMSRHIHEGSSTSIGIIQTFGHVNVENKYHGETEMLSS